MQCLCACVCLLTVKNYLNILENAVFLSQSKEDWFVFSLMSSVLWQVKIVLIILNYKTAYSTSRQILLLSEEAFNFH